MTQMLVNEYTKQLNIYNGLLFSLKEKKENFSHAFTTWIKLEGMPKEISQTQNNVIQFHLYEVPTTLRENRKVVCHGPRVGGKEVIILWINFSLG